jgi:hypothetical protein
MRRPYHCSCIPSAATGLPVEMVLPEALLQELRLPTQTIFRTLAVQRPTPGRLLAAARFDDQRDLYAIVETIRDLPLLSPQEREGIRVEQQAAPSERVLVYEDACTIVSDVPTLFAGANERLVLRAGQSGELPIGNIPFRVALVSSRFVSPKPCNQPLEGGQVRVDYVLTRAN